MIQQKKDTKVLFVIFSIIIILGALFLFGTLKKIEINKGTVVGYDTQQVFDTEKKEYSTVKRYIVYNEELDTKYHVLKEELVFPYSLHSLAMYEEGEIIKFSKDTDLIYMSCGWAGFGILGIILLIKTYLSILKSQKKVSNDILYRH